LALAPADRFPSAFAFAAALDPAVGSGGDELARLVDDNFSVELQAEERRSALGNSSVSIGDVDSVATPAMVNPRHGA
jgi:hypothetical protein